MSAPRVISIALLLLALTSAGVAQEVISLQDPDQRRQMYGFSILPPKGSGWFVVPQFEGHSFALGRDPGRKAAKKGHTAVASVGFIWLQGCQSGDECLQHGIAEMRRGGEGIIGAEDTRTVSLETSKENVPYPTCVRFTAVQETPVRGKTFEAAAAGLLCTHPEEPRLFLGVQYSERFRKGEKPIYSVAEEAKSFWEGFRFEPISGPRVASWVKLGPAVAGIAVGADRLWVQHRANISRIEVESGMPAETFSSGADGWALAYGAGALWVGHSAEHRLTRLDPDKGTVVATIPLPGQATAITEAFGSIWAMVPGSGILARVDPRTNTLVARISTGQGGGGVAAGHGSVWASSGAGGNLCRIDPEDSKVVARIPVCPEPVGIVCTQSDVWVACPDSGEVVAVNPTTGKVTSRVRVRGSPLFLDADAQALWVTHRQHGTLSRIDLETRASGTPIPIGTGAFAVRVAFGSVWVTDRPSGKLFRIQP